MKVVVIGGVAAGPKVASKINRLCPDAEVTIVEQGEFLSYAGCGLPYYISGVVKEQKELMATPVGTVRDSVFFQKVKNVKVLNRTKATAIHRDSKKVDIVNADGTGQLEYDKLVLATGASSLVPAFPGINLENIFSLKGVEDAEGIKAKLSENDAKDVVIVGGGLIGVETTEALIESGCRVTIIELFSQVLSLIDPEMALITQQYFESKSVKILTNTKVIGFEGTEKVEKVITDNGEINTDMVILSIGVKPNVELADEAGLEIGKTSSIKVNPFMQTSDPDIYAVGDCAEKRNLITGKASYVPLGSTANKEGRVAANNICGVEDSFNGILGSAVCKVFDYTIARTGLGEKEARENGYDVVTCLAPAPDKAHFMPDAKPLLLKLIADKKERKLIGAQAVGLGVADKRIDVAAMAITAGMTVDELANADLCYAPPYSPAMDNILTASNIIRNKIDGKMEGISSKEVNEMITRKDDIIMLDVRSPSEIEQMSIDNTLNIPLGQLRSRLNEIEKGKKIIAFCKISLRGYEAALILKHAGFTDVKVMDGGILMWPYKKNVS